MSDCKKCILIVEDEVDHADLIKHAFKSKSDGMELIFANNLVEARAHISINQPDVVIADYQLPDGYGTELLNHLGFEVSFPLVVMTAHGNEKVAVEAIKNGALDYVVKSEHVFNEMPSIVEGAIRHWNHIVEKKNAEQKLRLTQFTVDNFSDAVFWISSKGEFLYANKFASTLLGYSADELLQMSMYDIDPEASKALWLKFWINLKKQHNLNYETRFRCKDGRFFSVEITANYLEYEGQEYNCASVRDITIRKQIEKEIERQKDAAEAAAKELVLVNQQLEKGMDKVHLISAEAQQSEQAKNSFILKVNQELKKHVDCISKEVDLLLHSSLLGQKRKNLNSIMASTGMLSCILADINNLIRIETNKLQIETVDFSLMQMLKDFSVSTSYREFLKGLTFSYKIETGVPSELSGDPESLKQILTYITCYVLKFADAAKMNLNIGIDEASSKSISLLFTLNDNSVGIAPSEIEDSLKGFVNQNLSANRPFMSAEMGLITAKKIVGLLGGKMWYESIYGRGTTFYFTCMFGPAEGMKRDLVLSGHWKD